jgi:hypothetical protein
MGRKKNKAVNNYNHIDSKKHDIKKEIFCWFYIISSVKFEKWQFFRIFPHPNISAEYSKSDQKVVITIIS